MWTVNGLYGAVNLFLFIRDHLFPATWKDKPGLIDIFHKMTWWGWGILVLVVNIAILFEGAFRAIRKRESERNALAEKLAAINKSRPRIRPVEPNPFKETSVTISPLLKVQEKIRRAKAVTIGIGIKCEDGLILCSDTQMTVAGSHKFDECKIYQIPLTDDYGWACFTFAGDPELMKMFKDKISSEIQRGGYSTGAEATRKIIERVLGKMESTILASADRGVGLYTLSGIAIDKDLMLLKTSNTTVREVPIFDYVGVGDSSLIRYLGSLLLSPTRPCRWMETARVAAIYLVAAAKAFIDGCGGKTNLVTLMPPGRMEEWGTSTTANIEHRLIESEYSLAWLISNIYSEKSKQEIDLSVKQLLQEIQGLVPE